MKLPREIKLMEQIANRVEVAIYEAKGVCKEELLPWACYLSAIKSLRGIDKVLDFLRYHKPELAGPVEKAYQELLILATASDQECKLQSLEVPKSAESTLKACEDYLKRAEARNAVHVAKIELCQSAEIQSKALASKLRHIAKMARKDLTPEEPAEPEQNTTPAKWWRRGAAWLWKAAKELYRITVEVVVDKLLSKREPFC